MPLTAEDVSNKRFTTVRLREGYDMTEVDQFLDEVEAELRRLNGENGELRARLGLSGGGDATSSPAPADSPAASVTDVAPGAAAASGAASGADGARVPAGSPPAPGTSSGEDQTTVIAGPDRDAAPAAPAAAPSVETLKVTTTAEASAAATRLLELAGRSADQLVAEAEQRAGQIVGDAKSAAERLETETEERRKTLVADVDAEKTRLDAEVDKLRTFEREYRAELRTYFEEQLAALDGQGTGGVLGRSEPEGAETVPAPTE
jgi:DivIVA domain-containing protein